MPKLEIAAKSLASAIVLFSLGACAGSRQPLQQKDSAAGERTLKTQIFLDGQHFGPGVVDGRPGEFTRKALVNYRQAKGLAEDWEPDVDALEAYSSYVVGAADLGAIGVNASGAAAQSKQEKMPYTSLSELLAERFHTTRNFLRGLNSGMDLDRLAAGAEIKVPNIGRPFRFDAFPSTYPAPEPAVAKSRRIVVELRRKILTVMDGARTIAAFPITPGSSEHPAPKGEWRVVGAVPWPWYRHDEGVLSRGERTDDFLNLPPGPNNPVGILWAGLNRPGVGIHGTPVPDTIGRAGSHGCIRLANWDAAILRTLIGADTPVTIR